MPFVAKLLSTGERVDITRTETPWLTLRADDLVCQLPDCGAPMIIRAGQFVRAHFAHRAQPGKSGCQSTYQAHPETVEHRQGKLYIAEQLRQGLDGYSTARIEFEVPLPEVRRVADVLALFPNGWRVAQECQLAPITTKELEQRTEDYLHAGIDVVWWLGKGADTPDNRAWCVKHQDFSISLSFGLEYTYKPA